MPKLSDMGMRTRRVEAPGAKFRGVDVAGGADALTYVVQGESLPAGSLVFGTRGARFKALSAVSIQSIRAYVGGAFSNAHLAIWKSPSGSSWTKHEGFDLDLVSGWNEQILTTPLARAVNEYIGVLLSTSGDAGGQVIRSVAATSPDLGRYETDIDWVGSQDHFPSSTVVKNTWPNQSGSTNYFGYVDMGYVLA